MAKNSKKRTKKLSEIRRAKKARHPYKPPAFADEFNLALRYQHAGQWQQAENLFQTILSKAPDHYEATFALGLLYHQRGNYALAISLLEKTARLRPDVHEAYLNLGIVQRTAGLLGKAQESLENAVKLNPSCSKSHVTLGLLLIDRNNVEEATRQFQRAIKLDPNNPEAHAQLGLALKTLGDKTGATACYRQAVAFRPDYGEAHRGLAQLYKYTAYNDDVSHMEAAYHQPQLPEHERMLIAYALGKVYDDLQDYDKAFECLLEGNRLKRKTFNFSINTQQKLFEQHKAAFNSEFINRFNNIGLRDKTPIFVLGMPRSGTSLVEQILASHPDVYGAGEVDYMRLFPDGLQKLTGIPFPQGIDSINPDVFIDIARDYTARLLAKTANNESRVTDKLPHNFLRIGLIAAVMPQASIILCQRDPLDNCLSIFQHYFSAAHGYASELSELGQYYKLYQDLVAYWQQLLPEKIYTVNYEQLVNNTDTQVRKLLDFCALPFNANCLDFHKTERIVNTPSASQVREPMYKNAVARWKPYAQQLEPLKKILVEQ